MRQFYEAWEDVSVNRQLPAGEIEPIAQEVDITAFPAISPLSADEIQADLLTANRQLTTADLQASELEHFLSIGFTHHYELLIKTDSLEERLFYIQRCATEFWSVEKLKYHLKSDLYVKQGKLPNNFKSTISDIDLQRKALLSFKDEYLLDYINIESPDEEPDERVLESAIVSNIRKFIMSLGKDFSFIGNQYRLVVVEEQEYFIDLLFFNRQLQCLVVRSRRRYHSSNSCNLLFMSDNLKYSSQPTMNCLSTVLRRSYLIPLL